MRIEEREKTVMVKRFIAEDGTEFSTQQECESYEAKMLTESSFNQVLKLRETGLDNVIPPTWNEREPWWMESDIYWFKVNDQKEVDNILELFYKAGWEDHTGYTISDYPNYLIVEVEDSWQGTGIYTLNYDSIKKNIADFFESYLDTEIIYKERGCNS